MSGNERIWVHAKEPGILAEYLFFLQDVRKVSPGTSYNYYMTLRSLAKFLVNLRSDLECLPEETILHEVDEEDVCSITESEWLAYLNYYEYRVRETKGSLAVRMSIIRGFYEWLNLYYDCDAIGFIREAVSPIPEVLPQEKVISEEVENLLCSCMTGDNSARNICILRITIRCGLGLQELCDLDLEDIELDNILAGTGSKKRCIPLDGLTKKAIDNYLAVRKPPVDGSNAFFVGAERKRMHRSGIEKMLRTTVSRCGASYVDITIRDLQQTAKVRLAKQLGAANASALTSVGTKDYFKRKYMSRKRQQAG